MGAGTGIHIVTEGDMRYDSRAYATILAAYFADRMPDVILCGKQSQDTDSGLTGGMIAALLGIPYTTNAVGLELESDNLVVTRQGDAGREIVALPIPSLATCSNDMNDPRIPSLKGIMQSKKKTINRIALSDLDVAEKLGTAAEKSLESKGFKAPPPRPAGKLFEGSAEEVVAQLMTEL
jgi:electron transfer flavoprotein beta subunit